MARVRYTALVRIDSSDGLVEIGESVELDEADAAPLLAEGFLEEQKPAKPKAPAKPKPPAKEKPAAKPKAPAAKAKA